MSCSRATDPPARLRHETAACLIRSRWRGMFVPVEAVQPETDGELRALVQPY